MIESVLNKYTSRRTEEVVTADTSEQEGTEDLGVFGFLRGTRDRALMLELRKKDGNIYAVGYAWLERAEFDPSVGIILYVGGQRIQIKGRNLNAEIRPNVRLFQGLTRHRVPWIQEADNAMAMQSQGKGVLVEKIEW